VTSCLHRASPSSCAINNVGFELIIPETIEPK
jgi:hypothetical protein